jgi:hypothetical protein
MCGDESRMSGCEGKGADRVDVPVVQTGGKSGSMAPEGGSRDDCMV